MNAAAETPCPCPTIVGVGGHGRIIPSIECDRHAHLAADLIVHHIPGYIPKDGERFDLRLTCRACLRRGYGVEITGNVDAMPTEEALSGQRCILDPEHDPEWNVEIRWLHAWTEPDADDVIRAYHDNDPED